MRKYYFKLFPIFFVLISFAAFHPQNIFSKDINHYHNFLINNEKGHENETQEKEFIKVFLEIILELREHTTNLVSRNTL